MTAWDRLRAWWRQRVAKRDQVDADTDTWLDFIKTAEDHVQAIDEAVTKLPGQRLGRHRATKPGDIPDQPAGGADLAVEQALIPGEPDDEEFGDERRRYPDQPAGGAE